MPTGFQIGRVFKTNIYAAPSYFFLLVYCFLIAEPRNAAILAFIITVSVLVHEFGHVFAVRKFAGGDCFVVLWFLGGFCAHSPVPQRGKRIAISLMGPAFGFLLGGVAWLALENTGGTNGLLVFFLSYLVLWNLFWNAINLLPIWPLDGGQALLAALSAKLGGRAVRIVRRISILTAALGGIASLQFGFPFGAVLAIMLVAQNIMGRGPVHD